MPRELREQVLGYLALPEHVYTSSSTPHTNQFNRLRTPEKTYIDTRIYLPYHFPPNILATCRQLRHECLDHHAHLLNTTPLPLEATSTDPPLSWVLATRLGNETEEEGERVCDDGRVRVTIELQRMLRGRMGYAIPAREELSPRFLSLLSHIDRAHRLKIILWPGFDWWNRGHQPSKANQISDIDPACNAIAKVLDHFSFVRDLEVEVMMLASDASRWDLPDKKWQGILSWLNGPIVPNGAATTLETVSRKLTTFQKSVPPETFFTQVENRQDVGQAWKVERKGDMATVSHHLSTQRCRNSH